MTPARAWAVDAVDAWDGTVDTSWYDPDNPQTEYTINTAAQLAGLAELVNDTDESSDMVTFDGVTIKLAADLDLSGYEWISIGWGANTSTGAFGGVFDGQGHTISGLTSSESQRNDNFRTGARSGLFGALFRAKVRNVNITGATITRTDNDQATYGMGILADWVTNSTIENCHTDGSITGGSYMERYIGGIAGFMVGNNTLRGCSSSATITGNYANSGGLYDDEMSWWDSLGGIAGACYNGASTIEGCWFDGVITVNSIQAAVGGIVGYSEDATISNCLVATTNIGNDGLGNTCWIAYNADEQGVKNCAYPDNNAYDPSIGTDTSSMAVSDYLDDGLLTFLQNYASTDISWVMGVSHPVFSSQTNLIAADYTDVDEALAKVPGDLSGYTAESASALEDAVDAVVRGLTADRQGEVDAMAAAIEKAIGELEELADYSDVNAAIDQAEALDRDLYTEDSLAGLDEALEGVTTGLGKSRQDDVDAMAKAIEAALSALEYRPADYTDVDEALAKVPGDLSGYTAESASALKDAVDAVVRGLTADRQGEVDAMAAAIEQALNGLELKPNEPAEQLPSEDDSNTTPSKGNTDTAAQDALPSTGDSTALVAAIATLVGVFALGAGIFVRTRS